MSLINDLCYKYDKDKVNNLFNEYYNGNKDVENELILYNYTLVKRIINNMNYYNIYDYEEFESEGLLALIQAIRNYNPSLGYSFSTYATTCIRNAIIRFINNQDDKIFKISLNEIVKETENVKIENIIIEEDDCFKIYLQNDYINSLFRNIPLEYRDIAYKYFVQNISIFDIKNMYNYSANQLTRILKKCKNILTKAIIESNLSDKDIIISRFNELDEKIRNFLILYFQGYNYTEIGNKMNITHASYLIKKGIEYINYPIEQIKEIILNSDISIKDDCDKEIIILNRILNLNDNHRNTLLLRLKGYNNEEIATILKNSQINISSYYSCAIRAIGYTPSEIYYVLTKNNILEDFVIDNNMKILDFATNLFRNYNSYSKLNIDEIMNRFYNLSREEQECIIDYINKATNDEMVSKYNLTYGQVKRVMERKMDNLGGTKEEIRYCLAKRI